MGRAPLPASTPPHARKRPDGVLPGGADGTGLRPGIASVAKANDEDLCAAGDRQLQVSAMLRLAEPDRQQLDPRPEGRVDASIHAGDLFGHDLKMGEAQTGRIGFLPCIADTGRAAGTGPRLSPENEASPLQCPGTGVSQRPHFC